MDRALFLDRDGVINELVFYKDLGMLHSPRIKEDVKIISGVKESIKKFHDLGLKIIVVSNQPLIARGIVSEDDVKEINKYINHQLDNMIDAFYFCPHHPEHHEDVPEECKKYRIECNCRKPSIGLLENINIDIKNSFFIGDSTTDVKTSKNAGCYSFLVQTGHKGEDKKYQVEPDFNCKDLSECYNVIERIMKTSTIILAGGRGERLKPLTDIVPKPMIDVNDKPVLEYLLYLLDIYGIKNVAICGHYLFEKIKHHFGNEYKNVKIEYIEEFEPLGTGGAVKNAEGFIENDFILLNGDTITNQDLKTLIITHIKNKGLGTIVVRHTDHPKDSDLIDIDINNKITKFYSKKDQNKKGDIAVTGVFIFNKKITELIKKEFCSLENDIIVNNLDKGFYALISSDYFRDMGTFERLEKARNDVKNGLINFSDKE